MPVTDDGHAIGDHLEFIHPVRDIDDAGIGLNETSDEVLQSGHLSVVQGRGRLIHDKYLGLVGERLGNFDHLLVGDGQTANILRGLKRKVQSVDQLLSFGVEGALAEKELRDSRFATYEDILGHRQIGHQVELLMDNADAELLSVFRTGGCELLAV